MLQDQKVERVLHYAPLHYLPFVGRSRSLMCKPSLKAAGFPQGHLRSMSNAQDVERGFAAYAHLTLEPSPRILKAKLAAGFPHVGIVVPASTIDAVPYSLCRFNVAMTRFLRRDGKPGFPESATNGRYYDKHQIPIACTDADKKAMLKSHLPANTMIEVLVHGDLKLPNQTEVICFSEGDQAIAKDVLAKVGAPWKVTQAIPPGPYPRKKEHVAAVTEFIDHATTDPAWRGNGLEFDRF